MGAAPAAATGVPKHLRLLSSATQRRRIEIISSGADENLQTIGSDPYRDLSWPGLRVPTSPTSLFPNPFQSRYLFMLASFSIGEMARARIIGLRTSWTLGVVQATQFGPRLIEQTVTSPFFRLPDGNVSFHLRQSALNENRQLVPQEGVVGLTTPPFVLPAMPNLIFRNSKNPAMLFEHITFNLPVGFYSTNVSAYTPPNGGQPYGRPVAAGYGTFNDLKDQWASGNDWNGIDLPVEGPAVVQLFASVRQSAAATRPGPVNLPLANFYSGGISPEEAFLLNFPTAIIWRVAGSLMVEMDDPKEDR